MNIRQITANTVSSLSVAALATALYGPGTAFANHPEIHVTWEESPPPLAGFNYVITTTDPHFPDVELFSSSNTWIRITPTISATSGSSRPHTRRTSGSGSWTTRTGPGPAR